MRRGWLYLYLTLLRKKEKDVESVGSVAQSEKSPEKSQQKVFRNDYTAYTDYISKWGKAGYHAIEGRWMIVVGIHRSASPRPA